MGENELTDDLFSIQEDFASFVRLAVQGSEEDVRLYLAKLVRKHRARHPEFANKLDLALRTTHTRSKGASVVRREAGPAVLDQLPVDADTRQSLIRVFDDRAGLQAPILGTSLEQQVAAIIRERQERAKLAAHGISPTRSAVLVGPPGVGKTLSARWIAAEIGKPLWVLDLTSVMSSLLGKTGNNLRAVFEHAKANEAVLLLDEIDAIAKRRNDESDVGELKRLVTVILQEVDAWPDSSLLLAATNHPELIDPALWRRFDAVLTFTIGDIHSVTAAVRRFLGPDFTQFEAWESLLAAALQGMSLSEVERTITAMRRQAILSGAPKEDVVIGAVADRLKLLDKAERKRLAIEMANSNQLIPFQTISDITGVARDTIRKYAGPSPIKGRAKKKGE